MEEIKQWEIWSCDFSGCTEYSNFGIRPCIIISNDKNNFFAPCVNVVPLTTQSKNPLPTHCIIQSSDRTSFALCENITTVSKGRLLQYLGSLNEFEKSNVIYCLKQQLGI